MYFAPFTCPSTLSSPPVPAPENSPAAPPPSLCFTLRMLADCDKRPHWAKFLPYQNDGGLSDAFFWTLSLFFTLISIIRRQPFYKQLRVSPNHDQLPESTSRGLSKHCRNIWRDTEGPQFELRLTAKCLNTFAIVVFPMMDSLFCVILRPQQNKTWKKVSFFPSRSANYCPPPTDVSSN